MMEVRGYFERNCKNSEMEEIKDIFGGV